MRIFIITLASVLLGATAAMAASSEAADKGDFDAAVASSKEAEALAKASVYQATSEKTLWKEMEIR
jgi:hypothetical protein